MSAGRQPRPRRRARVAIVLVAVLGLAATGIGAGAALAAWRDATTQTVSIGQQSRIGISFGRVGGASTSATSAASVLTSTIGLADARTLAAAANRSVAIPFAVRIFTESHAGVDYTIQVPQQSNTRTFGAATLKLVKLPATVTTDAAATAACTLAATAGAPAAGGTQVQGSVPAGVRASASITQYWCFTAAQPGATANESQAATATATVPGGATVQVQANDSWVTLRHSDLALSLTHQLTLPVAP